MMGKFRINYRLNFLFGIDLVDGRLKMWMAWYYYGNISVEVPSSSSGILWCQSHRALEASYLNPTQYEWGSETQPRKAWGHVVKKDTVWAMILVQLQHPKAQILIGVKDCFKAPRVCYYLLKVPIRAVGLHFLSLLILNVCLWPSLQALCILWFLWQLKAALSWWELW